MYVWTGVFGRMYRCWILESWMYRCTCGLVSSVVPPGDPVWSRGKLGLGIRMHSVWREEVSVPNGACSEFFVGPLAFRTGRVCCMAGAGRGRCPRPRLRGPLGDQTMSSHPVTCLILTDETRRPTHTRECVHTEIGIPSRNIRTGYTGSSNRVAKITDNKTEEPVATHQQRPKF
jgi:hypothetical protein